MNINYKTYGDLLLDIKHNLHKIPSNIDLVVGIPRSGMIPAYILGFALNVKVCSLDEFVEGIYTQNGERPLKNSRKINNILIVDDSVASGNAMNKAKNIIQKMNLSMEFNLHFCAVYVNPVSYHYVDIALTELAMPRIFQWNYLNHPFIKHSCFDIDGVLCVDPTEEENDDGEKYLNFISNAKPLYIPKYKIRALVTSRLEKYREKTEEWLKKHEVQYNELYMLDLPSKEERLKTHGIHSQFKASIYKKLKDCVLFYESNREQAIEIANITGKTVFSVETDELINNKTVSINEYKRKTFFKHIIIKIFYLCVPANRQKRIK
ncbi:MAG: phosphoribosyl transferase, partial [Dysgonamonadaceae bacterium]|nr:phosphoribosyl transferase [Dysgonamonadaceae bacterium]